MTSMCGGYIESKQRERQELEERLQQWLSQGHKPEQLPPPGSVPRYQLHGETLVH